MSKCLQFVQVPLRVSEINNDNHPVEVGVADSYYVDRPIPGGCEGVI